MALDDVLSAMRALYAADPSKAVRSQGFIKLLHDHIHAELEGRLTPWAVRRKIKVVREAKIFGSHKAKDVDVAVIDPTNGPLLAVGVRSQMSSVGKNVLTYYQDIVGECISLQDRFPMCTYGYAYLHPLHPIMIDKVEEIIDHRRFARLYEAISGRDGRAYATLRGVYDEFAYLVVDFDSDPIALRDDIVREGLTKRDGTPGLDLSIETFVDRLVEKFQLRSVWLDIFTPAPGSPPIDANATVLVDLDSEQTAAPEAPVLF